MKINEYKQKLSDLRNELKARENALMKEFALANNPYPVGSIITDHCQTIKVDRIEVYWNFSMSLPMCSYRGPVLKKDDSPRKDGAINSVYQDNIVSAKLPS